MDFVASKEYLALKPLYTSFSLDLNANFRPREARIDSIGPGEVKPQYLPTLVSLLLYTL